MSAPKIPVLVVTGDFATVKGDAVIRLRPGLHAHAAGSECPACSAIGDVRVKLYELLDEQRAGRQAPIRRVIVDARELRDLQPTLDRLSGIAPATAMRDHVVARAFELLPSPLP